MANKKFFAGMLVMALVFGMVLVGCDDGSGGGDPALNGTWVASGYELILNNGSFEVPNQQKGTYTASNGSMTLTPTHHWGKALSNDFDAKWYNKADLKAWSIDAGMSDADLDAGFAPQTGTYSVTGNSLTFTFEGGSPQTLTKKN